MTINKKKKLNDSSSILEYRRSFDAYITKCFPKVTESWRENAWIRFCVKKGFHIKLLK